MTGLLALEIAIIFLLIIANGFFVAAEIAIVSARRSRLQQQVDAGKKSAQTALDLSENPEKFLATVQVGITLISTLTAAFGEASISERLGRWYASFPLIAPYAGPLSLGTVVLLITYFSLVLGELVPKRLALRLSENFAMFVAPFMVNLGRILRPAIIILNVSSNLIMRLLGQGKPAKATVTEEDIVYLAREGAVSGTVETEEEEFINRVFRFTDRSISAVMKPRTEMVAIEVGTPLDKVIDIFLSSGYTRVPLYEESLDNIIGVLYAKDLLRLRKTEGSVDLKQLSRPAFFVSEYQPIEDLLATFRSKGIHLAVVIDEYSQVTGIVTLEDLIEELIGEIQDEYDLPQDKSFIQREDGSWLVDALVDQEVVREKFGLQLPPGEERPDYHTLAGMILAHIGRIPSAGDTITIGNFVFEIVDMDGRRIDKVIIRPKKNPPVETSAS